MKRISFFVVCCLSLCLSCQQSEGKQSVNLEALALNEQAADLILHRQDSAALVVLDKSMALDSTILANYGMKVDLLQKAGRSQEALELLLGAEHLFEKDGQFAMFIALCYAQIGDSVQAHHKLVQASERYRAYFKGGGEDYRHVTDAVAVERLLHGKAAAQRLFDELRAGYTKAEQDKLDEMHQSMHSYDDTAFVAQFGLPQQLMTK